MERPRHVQPDRPAHSEIASVGFEPVEILRAPCDDDLARGVDVGHRQAAAVGSALRSDVFGEVRSGADEGRHPRGFGVRGLGHRRPAFGDDGQRRLVVDHAGGRQGRVLAE